ncbi:FecCD family ABC transporter permease [Paracoccus laeviglucosivorans]|uniref:Iron complex transport system permease protein n=1 Tax=Paracoccus laeviglucosivorans TaxID=1197861 RepID=A0A521ET50_9RHOB|nr:iron ABC transporter permease [Paracoccus laeviglucosivorans]SMO87087.1 iron complex transport system permease protein [Paracoccus laeviglucosivorans]
MNAHEFVLRLGPHISVPVSRRFAIAAPLLLIALLISAHAAMNMGALRTAPGDVFRALFLPLDSLDRDARLVAQFRLPRVGVALMGGAMMAASGYLLQVVSRNGLADPGLLGLSDGATVAVIMTGFLLGPIPVQQLSLISLGGALATALLVLGLGRRLLTGGGIILVGLAINILLGSVVEVILAAGTATDFAQLMAWSRGTLGSVDTADLQLITQWFALLLPVALLCSRVLQPMLLGEEAALALGVPARGAAILLVLLATAFAAPVIAACGPIAFVGLMSAWIARGLVGERPTEVLLTAMLAGAGILLWADTLGRVLFAPVVVSAGIMVSVVGALVFILSARAGGRTRS